MQKKSILTLLFSCLLIVVFSQSSPTTNDSTAAVFNRITKSIEAFQLDTSAVPNDKTTKKIIALRQLRGGFNINEAIAFKIEEDRQKKEVPQAELDKIAVFFQSGNGKRWLDNAIIRIYRKQFSYRELKRLVKFYKTSAGQKLATDFPIIMLQSLKAAEMLKDSYTASQKKD